MTTEDTMTAEGIVASHSMTKQEKLDRLNAMKMELGAEQQDRQVDPATVEQEMFTIDSAIERVKSDDEDGGAGISLGRAPSA